MTAPLTECPRADLRAIDRVFFDVDDTLTLDGPLVTDAVLALDRAEALGLHRVAVTGRSAAWGEMLLRVFGLDAAVAETGACCFYFDADGHVQQLHAEPDAEVRENNRQRRAEIAREVLETVPSARLASDNMGRVYDTAFDLVEDGPKLSDDDARAIRELCAARGLQVAQSSVHINAWFGDFDKASMVRRYLEEVRGERAADGARTMAYAGDSKNDASMFQLAGVSVGVANVAPHLDALAAMDAAPRFITAGAGGHGFKELIDAIDAARG